jgi:hypothetical protein
MNFVTLKIWHFLPIKFKNWSNLYLIKQSFSTFPPFWVEKQQKFVPKKPLATTTNPDSYLFVHYNIGICLLEKLDVDAHNLQIFKISSISSWTFSTSIGAFSISFPSKPPLSKHKPPWKILPFYLKWVGP